MPFESDYTPELADLILAGMSDGKSLRSICSADGMPTRVTVWRWQRTNEEFSERFDKARREGAHAMADDAVAIADDETLDPNSRRIRVDTRKWFTSKVMPKVYGDKLAVSGDETGAPLVVSWLQGGG